MFMSHVGRQIASCYLQRFCVLIKGLTNLKFFQNMPHSRATLYLIYIGQPSSTDVLTSHILVYSYPYTNDG